MDYRNSPNATYPNQTRCTSPFEFSNTIGMHFFFIAAFFQIIESIRITYFGALCALKDTRFTFLVSIISFWLVPMPIGYGLACQLRFGKRIIWLGMVAGACVGVVLLHFRFQSKIQKYKK